MSLKIQFERILVAVDGSENSFKACEVAAILASKFKSEVTALYVVLPLPSKLSRSVPAPMMVKEIDSEIDHEAKKPLEVAATLIRTKDVTVRRQVLHAQTSIVQAILEQAASSKTDLIVLGTRGLGGFKRMLLGSVSSGVATHASCPVLVVRSGGSKNRPQLNHMLVAVDGSENSSRATRVAANIGKVVGAELTVVHVVHIPSSVYSAATTAIEMIEKAAKEEGQKFVSLAASLAKDEGMINVKQAVIGDMQSPSRRITDYAVKNGIDLIVVGTRGLGGFKRLLLGSVATEVLGYAHCSVMVVKS